MDIDDIVQSSRKQKTLLFSCSLGSIWNDNGKICHTTYRNSDRTLVDYKYIRTRFAVIISSNRSVYIFRLIANPLDEISSRLMLNDLCGFSKGKRGRSVVSQAES